MKKLLFTLFSISFAFGVKAQNAKPLVVGDAAPNFSLTDQNGNVFNLADHIGKKALVIYFYPKDESMICTKEACAFRDNFDKLTKAGALVIGINGGTVASHKHFADKEKLPFILLSDPDNKVLNLFGVKGNFFSTGRETFVIDTNGKIVFAYNALLQGTAHAEQALEVVEKLTK